MSEIAKRIAGLSPKQYALLMQRLNSKQGNTAQPVITPRPRDASVVPLSFAQQRLWILHQIEPQSPSYNIAIPLSLSGALDILALRCCISMLVRRHEILRTTFTQVQNQPMQKIASVLALPLLVISLELLAADMRAAQTQRLIVEAARRPFDLARGPVLRATLLRLGGRDHVLILSMHHIIADGWSLAILLREMAALYAALVAGSPASLPVLPIQYADYAIWQRQHLQGAATHQSLAYWRQQLQDLPAALPLPTDRPRPSLPTFNGAKHTLVIGPDLGAALNTLAQQEGATLFMTLLAAFQLLLARTSGQDDVAVGTPIAGRTQAETEGLIGFFVNTLVLRTRLSGGWSFRSLLRQVREVYLEAYAHQDLPFEMLVEALQPERDLSLHPLFQVMFALQNVRMPAVDLGSLKLAPLPFDSQTTKFDLTLELSEGVQGLTGTLEYNIDLFDERTIARMAGHFHTLLEGIVARPEARIGELPLLSEAERRLLLVEWNDTQTPYPHDACIQRLFEMQATQKPDTMAALFDGPTTEDRGWKIEDRGSTIFHPPSSILNPQSLTYAELNQRANQLAAYLQTLGVGPDVPVAICMERSLELIVAILGILKAGGAYLPLDPTYPRERLAFMLENAQVQVLLTTTGALDKETRRQGDKETTGSAEGVIQNPKSKIQNPVMLCLDAEWGAIAQSSSANPPHTTNPEHLAYVIYTSGSTGRPKGVAMSHRPLVNLICWQIQSVSAAGGRKTLQFAPSSFDASFQEIFATWCAGGTLIMIDEERRRDPVALLRLLADTAVERLFLPFVALQQLAEAVDDGVGAPASLNEIITAGEQLRITPPVARMLRQLPGCVLHNHYGPSESHVVTAFTLGGTADSWPPLPPIGRPISNARIYLLDRQLQPVPIGAAGELYIGGIVLARGYLHRPDLTAAAFVPNPFTGGMGDGGWGMEDASPSPIPARPLRYACPPSPGTRLYKTGDLARYLPNGNIEFLGRIDQQVKIRGYRIELGEVEVVLGQHPAVQACAVMAREDLPGDRRLVAYVVPKIEDRGLKIEDSASDAANPLSSILYPLSSELRTFLQERLPVYMVPSAVVFLEAFPLNPSGKLDRRALPAPDATRPGLEMPFVAPRTPTEELLAGIWAEVLGRAQVGRDDHFFALGGHSLLATQVVARLRTTFAVELPLRTLFEAPTLAGLAARVAQARAGHPALEVPLQPLLRDEALPLSFAQQRLWFLDQLAPGSAGYTIPAAVRLRGRLILTAFAQTINAIMARHEVLRTTFKLQDEQPTQIIAPPRVVALPLIDLQEVAADARESYVRSLATTEARRPFDLATGPLLRVLLLRQAVDDHVVLLTMHHIISDGWSMGIFIRELAQIYDSCVRGLVVALPDLPIQYADYAVWQRGWLQGRVLETQLAYWREQLAGAPTALELPTDYPRPPLQTFHGAHVLFQLGPELTAELEALSRREGSTLFMVLLAVWQILLARYSRQEDIVVGVPIANRNRSEIEGLIGFFVNTLAIWTSLRGNPTFRELLGRVRETCLGAYAHQDLPFEMLVEALKLPRDLSRTPLFQVLFVLQNAPQAALKLEGVALEALSVESGTAKFDLTLALSESPNGLVGQLEYNTDLYAAKTIERLLEQWRRLLATLAADPTQRSFAVPLLTPAEWQQIVLDWNATTASYPHEACIHTLVQQQADRTPDALALACADHHLTYRALLERAHQLAHYLQQHAVGPDVPVGICMERTPELLIGILGVLSAGAAYVPLDPTYPAERLALMLADTRAPVVLTLQHIYDLRFTIYDLEESRSAIVNRKSKIVNPVVVCLDRDWASISAAPTTVPISRARPANLAYIIYTSGSTGRPKGVAISHTSAVALLAWAQTEFDSSSRACVLAATSVCFDLSIFELFLPLSTGGTVVLAENVLQLSSVPALQAVTLINTVPSALVELLHVTALPHTVRTVNLAGEALPQALAQQLYACATVRQVYNLYGPSEDTTYSTYARLAPDAPGAPPIGRPIANTQVYLLDAQLTPVPLGVAGEVYLGGAGLARGYLNRPELTAERFIPNPFTDFGLPILDFGLAAADTPIQNPKSKIQNGTRLYRTGDLARYRPDGQIEFLGRMDTQVKLRGYRIELGEIEAMLSGHPSVQACTVICREDSPGDTRLVAYVVPKIEDRGLKIEDSASDAPDPLSSILNPLSSELRAFLQQTLPAYMVPTAFVLLPALPLTPNGKLDRRALPAPASSQSRRSRTFVPPRDSLELQLVQIWEQILKISPVGVADNFFDLGGHSLVAVRLLARIQQSTGRKLLLATLFQHATIEQLAGHLRQPGEHTHWSPVVALQTSGTRRPFFCVHPVSGSVLGYVELARCLGPDQPFYGLQAAGLEGERAPFSEVADMAAAYVAAVRAIQPEGPYLLGGWSVGGVIAFEMTQQLRAQGQEVALLALLDSVAPNPSQWRESVADSDPLLLVQFVQDLAGQAGQTLDLSPDAIWQCPAEQRLSMVLEQAQSLGILPPDISPEQVAARLAVFKANLAAVRTYRPAATATCVVLLRASEHAAERTADPLLGWGPVADGALDLIDVPGSHYTMIAQPHVQELAERLRICFQNA